MSAAPWSYDGMAAAAQVLLRAFGDTTPLLRMSGHAAAGDEGEQLGLGTTPTNDVPLGPCVLRATARGIDVLVSGAAVTALVGSLAMDSAELLFATAAALVIDAVPHTIRSATAVHAGAQVVAYRVHVAAPTC